jgi:peptidyl-prolyl cis-trans isomerase B (cyclophilin B)
VVFAVAAAIASGCGGGSSGSTTPSGCTQVDAPQPKEVSFEAPAQTVKKSEKLTAAVETSCGSFEIAPDTRPAPKTVNSFAFLAREGLYDGARLLQDRRRLRRLRRRPGRRRQRRPRPQRDRAQPWNL